MEEAKLSGEALSRATGVSNATISNARHEQPLIVATAEKIAAALGKTVDELKAK
jgi:transcriptional regulator with XRE-family HTH domain